MGGSFALLGRGTAPSPLLFLTFYLFSFLVLISVMDGKEKFVYDASLLFLIGGALFHLLFGASFFRMVGGSLFLGLPLWMIYGLSRGRMGFGDVTLAFSLGLFLDGERSLLTLFLASLLGIAFSALMMALGRRKWRDPLPFAPFLCTAAFFFSCVLMWPVFISSSFCSNPFPLRPVVRRRSHACHFALLS